MLLKIGEVHTESALSPRKLDTFWGHFFNLKSHNLIKSNHLFTNILEMLTVN